jgi:excisionase family DNA binding protein
MDQLAYTIKQAAAQLGLSPRTVEGMIQRQELPYVRLGERGGAVRIARIALEQLLRGRQEVRVRTHV